MGNKTVVLYKRVKLNGKWTFQKVTGPRLSNLREGCYYVSWYEGSKKQMENIGPDAALALKALDKKTAELHFVAAGGQISAVRKSSSCDSRPTVQTRIGEYLDDCRDRQGKSGYGLAPRTVEAYTYRLGFLTEFRPGAYFDQVDIPFVKEFRRFLRNHPEDLGDRTCHNIMQAVSTFLISFGSSVAKPVLKEMSFPPKPVIRYSEEQMRTFFAACDGKEELIFKFFLHSMGRNREVGHCEVRDLLFDSNVLHISPKPNRSFRLKGKRSGQARNGRRVPIASAFMMKVKRYCEGKAPDSLLLPNGEGKVERHFLRMCKAIAKRAGLPNWKSFDLHRWRKTGATLHHEKGVSARKIQSWLGHESLEVTLDYLGVEDAADEFSQEQVNNGALKEFV